MKHDVLFLSSLYTQKNVNYFKLNTFIKLPLSNIQNRLTKRETFLTIDFLNKYKYEIIMYCMCIISYFVVKINLYK